SFGHHGYEIGQQLLAERGIVDLERLELLRAQDVENARDFGLDGRAARRLRDETHLADRGVAAEAAHPRAAAFVSRNHDADAPVQDEMHGIGGVAGADDGIAGLDLDPFAAMHQRHGIAWGYENLREPVTQ